MTTKWARLIIYFSTRVYVRDFARFRFLGPPKKHLWRFQDRLHLLRSWRYCTASPGGGPDSAPFYLWTTVRAKLAFRTQLINHSNHTSIPHHFHSNPTTIPKQRHSKIRHKRHNIPTAILHESQTITQQDRRTRNKIPYSNCAALTPQLHRAISQQPCKHPTVMPEEGQNNPTTIDHAKCKFHIEI